MKSIHVLLVGVLIICFSTSVFSQDTIILQNGDEIKSKVDEIGSEVIKYHKFDNLNGPSYTIEKTKVFMIKFENGSKEVYENTSSSQQPVTPQQNNENNEKTQPASSPKYVLEYKKGGRIAIKDKILTNEEIESILATNQDALKLYKSGNTLITIGSIVGYATEIPGLVGGFLIALKVIEPIPFAYFIIADLGSGLIASIVIVSIGRNKIKNAVEIYNNVNHQ